MKNQILDLLQWSSEQYDDRVFMAFWKWCENNSHFPLTDVIMPSITQQLMANSALSKWFMNEYCKCEQSFVKISNAIGNNNVPQLEAHYKACTAEVNLVYPKALMAGLKDNLNFRNKMVSNTPDVLMN